MLEPYNDDRVTYLLNSRPVRRLQEKLLRDYLKFGSGFVQMLPDITGNHIAGMNSLNAYFCRITDRDEWGRERCVISGKWPDNPSEKKDYHVLDILDEYDPLADLRFRKEEKKGNESSVMVVRDSWSNKEVYSEPIWLACYLAGWIDIAKEVPKYLRKVNKNQATWKWHIQIPYSFWEEKFPTSEFDNDKSLRETAIQRFMDDIERNLLGAENAEKPIFTHYNSTENGKVTDGWIITPLDNKSKESDKLVTSAAANSEILFSLMINPNVMGAGMPGGAYAGNQGGSNIREAFLVNIANAWVDRQSFLDPLRIMLLYNGADESLVLRNRNTVLTTLDTNAGTAKTLS
jgi:hypothetical protein